MRDCFVAVLFLLYRFVGRRSAIQLRFARAQTIIAMSRDRKQHYILTPKERRWLLFIGAELDHDVKDLLVIVTWKTYRRCLREAEAGKEPGHVGRKKTITQDIIDLVVRMARENVAWGKMRIVGELKKLAIIISAPSVARILLAAGMEPPPDKGNRPTPVITWSTFVSSHLESIVAL